MNRAHIQNVSATRASLIATPLLHRVDTSQLGSRDGVSLGACITTPVCVHGFGNSDCAYPSCKCHAASIKEPRTQEEHAEHLEATREPRSPSHFRPLVKYCLASAVMVVLAGIFFVRL